MIGLDTNVLIRYIVQDDPRQAPVANQLIESLSAENPGFISTVALVELYWVLQQSYKLDRKKTTVVIQKLLHTQEVLIQGADAVYRALKKAKREFDFPDALIGKLNTLHGCSHTATFDKKAAQLPNMMFIGEAQAKATSS